ncbi:MAG: CHAT domain-containing protein [Bacteroidota bacterium]
MKFKLLLCFLLINFLATPLHAQDSNALQQEFNRQLANINALAKMGNIEQAIAEALKTKDFAYQYFKDSNSNQKQILFKLNFYYRYIKDYANELATNVELNKIRENDLLDEQNSFKESLTNLTHFYNDTGNTREVIPVFSDVNKSIIKHARNSLKRRFNDEKAIFIEKNIIPFFHLFQSFAYNTNYKFGSYNNMLVDNTRLAKGALLGASKDIIKKLRSLNNRIINLKINKYIFEKEFIAYQMTLKDTDRASTFKVRKERLDALESEILHLHNSKFKEERLQPLSWRRTPIKTDEIVIEFSHFNLFDKVWTNRTIYVAQLFKKEWRYPKVIPLFEANELIKLLNKDLTLGQDDIRGSKATNMAKSNSSSELYKLIFEPLEVYLKNVKTIYFSPDGLLHQISFPGLKKDNNFLIQNYELRQIGDSKTISKVKKEPELNDLVLIGGVAYDYNYDTENQNKSKTDTITTFDFRSLAKSSNGNNSIQNWGFLSGSETEIDNIAKILKGDNKKFEVLKGSEASERKVKSFSGNSPKVLHIATHGYFIEKSSSEATTIANRSLEFDEPLLRSGLILANANYAWTHGNNPYQSQDGILTALEISNLDLSKTDLVVLSACDTALGDIKGNEGVYGLQRAFKMAGVKLIIMSLWEVPDIETSEFMTNFYNHWLNGLEVRTAFRNTQLEMSKKYENNPEKWAAFVLFE